MTLSALHSLEFVESEIASPEVRLLEVGCGEGELASLLSRSAIVTAIDKSEEALMCALQRGVNAQLVDLFDYPESQFDVVLFMRSLHHIEPLGAAVAKAASLLSPHGILILEEFAPEIADQATVDWVFKTRRELIEGGLIMPEPGVHHIDMSLEPMDWWRGHHFKKHRVATAESMRAAVSEHFEVKREEFVPYVYRYLLSDLVLDADDTDVQTAIFAEEMEQIKDGKLRAIGYRLVAVKK